MEGIMSLESGVKRKVSSQLVLEAVSKYGGARAVIPDFNPESK